MKEISLHILDIVQNSISAGATLINVSVDVDKRGDMMRVEIKDNGCGMDEAMAKKVISPFTTSRTTRKVGLGIPFFKEGAEGCDGSFSLTSKVGEGTTVAASYRISHIDRAPLGDMAETMTALCCCNPDIDFTYDYTVDGVCFSFSTKEIKASLGPEVPLSTPQVAAWIKEYLNEGIQELNGGV